MPTLIPLASPCFSTPPPTHTAQKAQRYSKPKRKTFKTRHNLTRFHVTGTDAVNTQQAACRGCTGCQTAHREREREESGTKKKMGGDCQQRGREEGRKEGPHTHTHSLTHTRTDQAWQNKNKQQRTLRRFMMLKVYVCPAFVFPMRKKNHCVCRDV